MISTLLLHILVYVIQCTAAPQPLLPVKTIRLQVSNSPQRGPSYYGYVELDNNGKASFNITSGYQGFDVVI